MLFNTLLLHVRIYPLMSTNFVNLCTCLLFNIFNNLSIFFTIFKQLLTMGFLFNQLISSLRHIVIQTGLVTFLIENLLMDIVFFSTMFQFHGLLSSNRRWLGPPLKPSIVLSPQGPQNLFGYVVSYMIFMFLKLHLLLYSVTIYLLCP